MTRINLIRNLVNLYVSWTFILQLCMICIRHSLICEEKSRAAQERTPRKRFLWREFVDSLSDKNFRRTFRMSKGCFKELCKKIKHAVGEEDFKSEEYIRSLHYFDDGESILNSKKRRMFYANSFTTGGYICGEVKLAITLRLLAGGSYLDIAALYCSGYTYTYTIFHDTIRDWICNDRVIAYPGLAYFDDIEKLRSESRKFQTCGSHGGIISGCIGALDGCRKGFYAINVQAIVNKEKLVLWRSIKCKGSEHDSTAFKKTTLHNKLLSKFQELLAMGFYIVGDSAYAIRSFLLTPFDNALPNSAKDSFNYHHSTCRIWVECAFGEIDMRWGIFWKPLQFDLDKNLKVIDAAMRLHNYLVQNRDNATSEIEEFQVYERETVEFILENPFENVGVFNAHEENQDRGHDGVGRSTREIEACTNEGKRLRQFICNNLERQGKVRPRYSSRWKKDKFNRTRQT